MTEVRCVWEAGAVLGEGPVWLAAEGAVYWVDIKAKAVHRYHPASGGRKSFGMAAQVCAVIPRRAGGFVATTRHGLAAADLAAGALAPLAEVEPDQPGNRFNDAKADPAGRLWAGTMDDAVRRPTGTLYRFDADHSWRAMDGGYVVTNGPAFSSDGTVMYHNDSVNRRVFAFDLDGEGGIANKRTFLAFGTDEGVPDGMAVDVEGGLWIAHYGGGRVTRFTPGGRADHVVTLPVAQVTSCVFGGPRLDTLYITSAAQELDAGALRGQPLAGGLFEAAVGIQGLPTAEFAGQNKKAGWISIHRHWGDGMKDDVNYSAKALEQLALPEDGTAGTLVGRAWAPVSPFNPVAGPAVVVVRRDGVYDISRTAPTVADLMNAADPLAMVEGAGDGVRLGAVGELLANSFPAERDPAKPWFLAPIDLQSIKAAGVTFAASLIERVIEERAKGDPGKAEAIRADFSARIGTDLSKVKPGSEIAERLKQTLIQEGLWSQYLEVGIGPYAEVFTKSQTMSAVGFGAEVGVRADSTWNNPEPEIVLVVNARGQCLGATLGNDVNLRDFEGRSALLLGKAKDNNASCAIGPFIRLFDKTFSLDDVRRCDVTLDIEGPDGFSLAGVSSVSRISRDLLDLVGQTIGIHHQYPDGLVLFIGTMFAPTQDRGAPGKGFTHQVGDVVRIASPKLGTLLNRVNHCDKIEPWTFGISALVRNLVARGLLQDVYPVSIFYLDSKIRKRGMR